MIRAFATCMLTIGVVIPCNAQVSVDSRRSDVIVLTAAGANDTTERAAGMYVGHDASNAFFITAAHALTHAQAGQVQVTSYGSAVPINAGIVEQKDDALDLAVVYIPVGSLPGGITRGGISGTGQRFSHSDYRQPSTGRLANLDWRCSKRGICRKPYRMV